MKFLDWINFTFLKWLAGKLPRWLVYWCAIRVTAVGKSESGQFIIPDDKSAREMVKKYHELCYNRRVYWHSQNLSNDKHPTWQGGRGWLNLWGKTISAEWYFGKQSHHFGATFTLGGEERPLRFFVGIRRVFCLFLSFSGFLPYRWFANWKYWGAYGRDTGIKIHDGKIWIPLWFDDTCVSYPNWIRISGIGFAQDCSKHGYELTFDPADFFLGRAKFAKRKITEGDAVVILPEGQYPVYVTIEECTWKRPRWPKIARQISANVDCGKGIPAHAGKGENDWDLDDDALFSMSCPVGTIEEAVKRVANSILRDREKYGTPALS